MFSSKLFVALTLCGIVLQLTMGVYASCVCKEKGIDYCASCSGHHVVRPKPKFYEPNPDLHLPPIGDNCWCSKQMIEPAALPKTCHKHKPHTCTCKTKPPPKPSCGHTYSAPGIYAAPSYPLPSHPLPSYPSKPYPSKPYPSKPYPLPSYPSPSCPPPSYPPPPYAHSKYKDDSLAADPISVSLAIQAGKAINVPEAKLAYGPLHKPVDGLKKVYFSSVPEENLYKLKHDIITLKKPSPKKHDDDWVDLEEEEEDEGHDDSNEHPRPTYKQLGYKTEYYKNPKFRPVKPRKYSYSSEEVEYKKPVKGKYTVDCGYKPGRIQHYSKEQGEYADSY